MSFAYCGGWQSEVCAASGCKCKPTVEGVTHLGKDTPIPGFSFEDMGMALGKQPRDFLSVGFWGVLLEESQT